MTHRYAFLKFPNRGAAISASRKAYPTKGKPEEGEDGFKGQSSRHFLYDVGKVQKTKGKHDPKTGEVIKQPTYAKGIHFNLLLLDGEELPEPLKKYEIQVDTPSNTVLGLPYD